MKYSLVGGQVDYSYSPLTHILLGAEEYGLDSLDKEELKDFFTKKEFSGLNVTSPYKEECIKYLDKLSPLAKRIGAVNTVTNRGGVLTGYNSDYYGVIYMAKCAKISFKNKTVLILGNGGASKMAKVVAKDYKAKKVYVAYNGGKINFDNVKDICADAEIIINATPVGSETCQVKKIINLEDFKRAKAVLEMIYTPFITPLLFDAINLKIRYGTGLQMLIYQAVISEQFFQDKKLKVNPKKIIERVENNYSNIVLTGFAGAGKSTVGKAVAKFLGRPYYDTDEMIEKGGEKIEEIFAKFGEEEFRKREKQVIKSLALIKGAVISTGGGALCDGENFEVLKSNGKIIFIDRKLKDCNFSQSPKFQDGKEAEKVYRQRLPLYKKADCTVKNKNIEKTAKKIIKKLKLNAI